MKIKLNTNDDDLNVDRMLSFPVLSIVVTSVFQNENKNIIHKFTYMSVSMSVNVNHREYTYYLFIF